MTEYIYIQPETGVQCECFSIRGKCRKEYFTQCANTWMAQFPEWISTKGLTVSQFGSGECCLIFDTKFGFYEKYLGRYHVNIFRIPPQEQLHQEEN